MELATFRLASHWRRSGASRWQIRLFAALLRRLQNFLQAACVWAEKVLRPMFKDSAFGRQPRNGTAMLNVQKIGFEVDRQSGCRLVVDGEALQLSPLIGVQTALDEAPAERYSLREWWENSQRLPLFQLGHTRSRWSALNLRVGAQALPATLFWWPTGTGDGTDDRMEVGLALDSEDGPELGMDYRATAVCSSRTDPDECVWTPRTCEMREVLFPKPAIRNTCAPTIVWQKFESNITACPAVEFVDAQGRRKVQDLASLFTRLNADGSLVSAGVLDRQELLIHGCAPDDALTLDGSSIELLVQRSVTRDGIHALWVDVTADRMLPHLRVFSGGWLGGQTSSQCRFCSRDGRYWWYQPFNARFRRRNG